MKRQLAIMVLTMTFIVPASAQTPPVKAPVDGCVALWKDFDDDEDGTLSDAEAARLKTILAVIDMNKDGTVSKEEFFAACENGLLKDVKKK